MRVGGKDRPSVLHSINAFHAIPGQGSRRDFFRLVHILEKANDFHSSSTEKQSFKFSNNKLHLLSWNILQKKNVVKTSHKHAWCPCHWQRSAPLFFQRRKHSMSIARSCLRYLYLSIKFSFSLMYLDGDFHRYSFERREVDDVSHPRRRWRRSAEIYFSQFF